MKVSRSSVRSSATILALAILAMLPARGASAAMLYIAPSIPTLMPGNTETVSVMFTNGLTDPTFTLGAADIEIAFDSTRFAVSNVILGSLDPSSGYNISPTIDNVNGTVYTGIYSNGGTGAVIASGASGTLATFTLTALANAPLGGAAGDINLLANANNANQTVTAVYDNSFSGNGITLTPNPSNGVDSTDGTVVISATVPEPSSLILMGLGGGLIIVTSRFRKKARRPSTA